MPAIVREENETMNSNWVQRELLGISAVWWREFKVFWREKSRIVSSVVQPMMWLFLFGSGIGASLSVGSVNYRDYIYPGVLTMSVIFGSVFFGLYIIWDRKLDVLKAVLVAPVTRISIFFGKVLGGCTDVLLQVVILFVFSFLFPSVNPWGIPQALLDFAHHVNRPGFAGAGAGIPAGEPGRVSGDLSFSDFPSFFLSGALFPVDDKLPAWLHGLVKLNPLSYTVDGVRGALLGMNTYPFYVDLGIITLFAAAMLILGSILFSRMK
ncbi:MAG: ABC transporter permease [Desulfobacterales bacterium]|nr:ABC transporter permease [Desulfobacterales bacterium]